MITITDNPGRQEWDRYAGSNSDAVCSHLFGWGEQLAAAYNLPLFRLAAKDSRSTRILGILPLILFSPPTGERRLISLPYTDAAGITADDNESGHHLLAAALELADSLGAMHLELRQYGMFSEVFSNVFVNDRWSYRPYNFKTGLKRPLPSSPQQLWSDLPAKVRNQVRKACRSGCTSTTGGVELLEDFYVVFSENMRDLGSPVHPCGLFHRLLTDTDLLANIVIVYLHQEPVAGGAIFCHNKTATNPWASSLRRCRPYCPNMLLYWSMLEYAILNDCNRFDFGRSSPGASTCRFKIQWGARQERLNWHVFSRLPAAWDPRRESLSLDVIRQMELEDSRRAGPAIRRWISL